MRWLLATWYLLREKGATTKRSRVAIGKPSASKLIMKPRFYRGYAWQMKGNLTNAVADYERAERLNPNSVETKQYLHLVQSNLVAQPKKVKGPLILLFPSLFTRLVLVVFAHCIK